MLPEFLKRENRRPMSENEIRFGKALDRYEEYFGEKLPTEPSSFSVDEWVKIIDYCIENNLKYEDISDMSDYYDDDVDY